MCEYEVPVIVDSRSTESQTCDAIYGTWNVWSVDLRRCIVLSGVDVYRERCSWGDQSHLVYAVQEEHVPA
eukprot:5423505-Prymnesium_polylepis.1